MPRPEAHPGDEVDREHRDPRELVDEAKEEEGEDDRKAPHEQREGGGDKAAEDPEGEQEKDREGEHLRALEIGGGGFVDLVEGDVVAAEAHAATGDLGADVFDRTGGVVAVGERGEHEREVAVAGDEQREVGLRVVDRPLEAGLGGKQREHAGALTLRDGIGASVSPTRHKRDKAEGGGLVGGAFDRLQHLLVLGGGVLEVGVFALQQRNHRPTERGGKQEHGARDEQRAPRMPHGEVCETCYHRQSWLRGQPMRSRLVTAN